MSTEWYDAGGNELAVGDDICYANVHGRSANLKFGKITKLTENGSVQCVAVDRCWRQEWTLDGGHWDKEKPLKCRVNTLTYLDRILKIDELQMPTEVIRLLDIGYEMKKPRTEEKASD